MLTIEIVNTTKNKRRPEFGTYTYTVKVGLKVLAEGIIENHQRSLGWQTLLEDIAREGRRETSAHLAAWLAQMEYALDANLGVGGNNET